MTLCSAPISAPRDSADQIRREAYRQSRASTNSSFFSHESHGPQTPRADSGLSLVICPDESEYHSPEEKPDSWWADLTPRVPQLDSSHSDGDVCVDDSPTLPDVPFALLKHFPKPPPTSLAPPNHLHPYPTASYQKSESTETLHAQTLSPRRVTPPRTKPPERPLPLDPEKLAEVNRALRDLGLQELASASVLTPGQSANQARRPRTPSSDNASLKSSKSLQSVHSVAPSIPNRSSSRRTPSINSRASSLKLIRTPYGVPTEPTPYPRSASALSGLSRFTSTSESYASSSASGASIYSAKSPFRSPRSSFRNSSIRSSRSHKLPSIFELPRDLDLVPSGDWALREQSPYRIYGASKSTPDLHEGRDMSLRQKLKHRKLLGGSPPLHGTSFIDLGGNKHWQLSPLSPLRGNQKEAALPWEQRLASLKARLLQSSEATPSRGAHQADPVQDLFSPVSDFPPQLDDIEPEQPEESLLDDVRAMVEAKGWDWPAPPDFSAPGPTIDEVATEANSYADEQLPAAPESTSESPMTTTSALTPNLSSARNSSHDPITPSQTHSSTFTSTSMPHTPHTPSTPRSSIRATRAPAAPMDLSEELDAIDQAEAERIAEEEKAKAIANGTYVDLRAPRTRAIGFSAPSPSLAGSDESAPSIQKAKMKKEPASPMTSGESKGGMKFMRGFRKTSKT